MRNHLVTKLASRIASWLVPHRKPKLQKTSRQPTVNHDKITVTGQSIGSANESDPIKVRRAAIAFLRDWLFPEEINSFASLIGKHGHRLWIWHVHDAEIAGLLPQEKTYAVLLGPQFGFGRQVRNALRRAGFGEQELGVPTLDDVYVDLLEAAVQPSRGTMAAAQDIAFPVRDNKPRMH